MPWVALPGDDIAGEVRRLLAAYRQAREEVARIRAELAAAGYDAEVQARVVAGVDAEGRAVVRLMTGPVSVVRSGWRGTGRS